MTGGRIALLIAGALIALLGFALALGGAGVLAAQTVLRGDDGFITSPDYRIATDAYALTAEEIDLRAGPRNVFRTPWPGALDVTIDVTPTDADQPIFVGIAPRSEVAAYLAGVAHDEVTRLGPGDRVRVSRTEGAAPTAAPGTLDIWVAQAEGAGAQTLTWELEPGRWGVVVMNADGSAGVDVEVAAGARAGPVLLAVGIGLLVAALILIGAAAAMIVAATARRAGEAPTEVKRETGTPAGTGVYPLVIEGGLDPPLSRGLWLVKWLLLIPHYIVLALLWMAFVVLTIVAGFAILFTGRYPRGIFDINVGILRWTWRVGFYGYSALATDRYPPFSLAPADYPAMLDVAYPERLSRGLVLVKWWLLALPHYLIIAVLAGGGLTWTLDGTAAGGARVVLGGGLIGLLALIVGVVLLFRARYPDGLFDLLMGLSRWVYRVIAYAALMTDEYPPFRLDSGGGEPAPAGPPQPGGPKPKQIDLPDHAPT